MAVIIKKNEKVEYVVNLLCDNFSNDEKIKKKQRTAISLHTNHE